MSEHPWEKCRKPCDKTHRDGLCNRRCGHTGKHRDWTNPDCILGHEMTVRGTTYSCAKPGDHRAAYEALEAFVEAGGCRGCKPPQMVWMSCPQHGREAQDAAPKRKAARL